MGILGQKGPELGADVGGRGLMRQTLRGGGVGARSYLLEGMDLSHYLKSREKERQPCCVFNDQKVR